LQQAAPKSAEFPGVGAGGDLSRRAKIRKNRYHPEAILGAEAPASGVGEKRSSQLALQGVGSATSNQLHEGLNLSALRRVVTMRRPPIGAGLRKIATARH